jgi:hypothetical protein
MDDFIFITLFRFCKPVVTDEPKECKIAHNIIYITF